MKQCFWAVADCQHCSGTGFMGSAVSARRTTCPECAGSGKRLRCRTCQTVAHTDGDAQAVRDHCKQNPVMAGIGLIEMPQHYKPIAPQPRDADDDQQATNDLQQMLGELREDDGTEDPENPA